MLFSVVALLIAVQQPVAPAGTPRDTVPPAKVDTSRKGRGVSITLGVGDDSTITGGDSTARAAKRIPVPPAHIATAYANDEGKLIGLEHVLSALRSG